MLICGTLAVSAPRAAAATPEEVDKAIARAQQYLLNAQGNKGNWEMGPKANQGDAAAPFSPQGGQYGGLTALATYALLASGVDDHDSHIKAAVEWLKYCKMEGIYALGVRCQVWNLMPHSNMSRPEEVEINRMIEQDTKLILQGMETQGDTRGLFDYLVKPPGSRWDHSASQYGVLGLWAAQQMNVEISQKVWAEINDAWSRQQLPDGGWEYSNYGDPKQAKMSTATMTAAGIATLFIAQDYLNPEARCSGNLENPVIDKGLAWFGKNFDRVFTTRQAYCLYGVERIGVASGYKYFGTTNWYERGADFFLRSQGGDGAWVGDGGTVGGTAFGLLFLTRGRAPVFMNKLQYTLENSKTPANWNQRPRDAAHVAAYVAAQTENHSLNWQIVNLNVAPEELHDAPFLYIAGNQALLLSKTEVAKLKTYVEQGGTLLFNADCGSRAFSSSVIKLTHQMFPDYEWRNVPADNVIYKKPFPVHGGVGELQGLSNGARELMLMFPSADPARGWQTGAFGGGSRAITNQLMVNLYAYGTDLTDAYVKGKTYWVTPNGGNPTNTLKVARLQWTAGVNAWDPEPGGWARMSAIMRNDRNTALAVEPVELGKGKLLTGGYKVAHMTGTIKFHLNDEQGKELQQFVQGGGTLVIDACGGSGEFSTSAEIELGRLFPDLVTELGKPVSISDPVFNVGGTPIKIEYRPFALTTIGNPHNPQLCIGHVNKRPAIYFSRQDLSVGMVGMQIGGIYGYKPDVSTEIMENILTLSAGGGAPVAAAGH